MTDDPDVARPPLADVRVATTAVAVTGGGGPLGQRVIDLIGRDPAVAAIVSVEPGFPGIDLALDEVLDGVDTIVHLDPGVQLGRHATARPAPGGLPPGESTRRLLDAAARTGVRHLVLLSSATVYGAWPDNPVPLTEDAPVRPNPGAESAQAWAEIERLGAAWASAGEGRTVAVLRPTESVAAPGTDGRAAWVRRRVGIRLPRGIRPGREDPPFQLLDLDDLASAVDLARRERLDGPFNVAPDGWLSGDELISLAGDPPRVRLPEWLVAAGSSLLGRWRIGRRPLGLVPYSTQSWVVANDRLKARGWAPTVPNDVAYVESTPGTPWSRLSPKRRQELALGAAGAIAVGALAGLAALVLRARRRA